MLKIQSEKKSINLASDRSVRRPNSNGVNDTPIQVCMKKIEVVKVVG